jgi:ABC-type Zn2+ transport system substrate-binding protein/surface adhesin
MVKIDLTEKLKEELMKRNLFEEDDEEDDEDEDEDDNDDDDDAESDNKEEESSNSNEDFCEMVCQLLHSQTQVHIFHLGTKSYSEHKALQKFYKSVDGLTDGLIESFQGKYGLLTNYKSFKNQSYKNKNQVLKYFTSLLNMIEEKRDCCDDSYLQNQIDTIQELIYSTMYKLKFLQ